MTAIDPADSRRRYFLISLVVVIADQISKVAVHAWMRPHDPVTIIPGLFNLSYSRNRGGLFGYFGELSDPWRALLLTLLPLLAIVMVSLFIARSRDMDRPSLIGLALILGGAVGNLIDRIFRGEVVDFLDAYVSWDRLADWLIRTFGTAHWPTFNVADSAIVCGALLLAWGLARPPRGTAGAPPAKQG
jgi:signal peptidase II